MADEDDDIQIGTSMLSLKDPVSDSLMPKRKLTAFKVVVFADSATDSIKQVFAYTMLRRYVVDRVEFESPSMALSSL